MESITDLRRSFFRSRSLLLLLIRLVIPLTSFHVFPPIDLAPVTLWSDKASHGPSLSFSLFISVTILPGLRLSVLMPFSKSETLYL